MSSGSASIVSKVTAFSCVSVFAGSTTDAPRCVPTKGYSYSRYTSRCTTTTRRRGDDGDGRTVVRPLSSDTTYNSVTFNGDGRTDRASLQDSVTASDVILAFSDFSDWLMQNAGTLKLDEAFFQRLTSLQDSYLHHLIATDNPLDPSH